MVSEQRDKREATMDRQPYWNVKDVFEVDDDGGDFWYNNFRRNECDGNVSLNHCKRFRFPNTLSDSRLNRFEENAPGSQLYPQLDTPDSSEYSDDNENRNDRDLSDQDSTKKNDLSHEADYKLSKFEQDHQMGNQSDLLNRIKRSLSNSEGRPIAILASSPIKRSKLSIQKTKKQIDDYDEEIEFPEPMLAEQVLKNLGIKTAMQNAKCKKKKKQNETEILDNEDLLQPPLTEKSHLSKSNEKQTEVLEDEDLLGQTLTNKSSPQKKKKNQIGITLELKVNNVTKQKFEAITQLRRRKKSAANDIDSSPNKVNNLRKNNLHNEVVSAVFELVRSNEMLKNHIGPMLDMKYNPKFETSYTEQKVY